MITAQELHDRYGERCVGMLIKHWSYGSAIGILEIFTDREDALFLGCYGHENCLIPHDEALEGFYDKKGNLITEIPRQ